MKTLPNHTIIYDSECPMCNAYTKLFVTTGMLDKNGRETYNHAVVCNLHGSIDWDRARNEIAIIDKETGTVRYGIDSMIEVIVYSLPWLKRLLLAGPIYFLLKRLYSFISYNRKVIAPAQVFEGDNACTPTMNYPWRIAYIILAWLITSFVLVFYTRLLVPLVPPSSFVREFLVCGGQILFQGIVVGCIHRQRLIHYLGNMMTVSLAGAIALTPALLLTDVIHIHYIYIGYFMVIVGLMFFEHWRRVKIIGLPWAVSITWVLYRLLVLGIIL